MLTPSTRATPLYVILVRDRNGRYEFKFTYTDEAVARKVYADYLFQKSDAVFIQTAK